MANISGLIETALYGKLSADTGLLAAGVTGVFEALAPTSATMPYVIFRMLSGGDSNSSPRRNIDAKYLIEGVAATRAKAREIAAAIDTALHQQELIITGWSNWRLESDETFTQVETVEGKQFYRRGAIYRISFDKN